MQGLLLFSSIRQSPRPTLFLYTTLFRSFEPFRGGARVDRLARELEPFAEILGVPRRGDRTRRVEQDRAPAAADRKSTRLNSSHRTISYPVFCLKKTMKQ